MHSHQERTTNPSLQSDSCSRTVPLHGTWNTSSADIKEWTFTPRVHCNAAVVSNEQARSCLRDRRVFALGNSIARQFAFELPAVVDNAPVVARVDQKGLCSKTGLAPERCETRFGDGSVAWSAWFLYFDGLPTRPAHPDSLIPGWEVDTCGHLNVSDCVRSLTEGASADDIMLTNVGIAYALWDPDSEEDVQAWRRAAVRNFIAGVNSVFPGTVVYMPVSPMRNSHAFGEFPKRLTYERAERLNELVLEEILQGSSWHVFDVWSMMKPVLYTPVYNDAYHFQGVGTRAGWNILLRMLCEFSP